MKLLLSKHNWFQHIDVAVSGFIRTNDRYIMNYDLASYFRCSDRQIFEDRLREANGQFAVIVKRDDELWAATDRLRTIPLFYHFHGGEIIIGDSAYALAGEMNSPEIDNNAASAFLATGYTLNNLTLIKDLYQLEAGEMVVFRGDVLKRFYFDYSRAHIKEQDFIGCSLELKDTIGEIFRSHFYALKDRFIAIPLSGGYDSRLIAAMCKRYHPENVLCYTYGREDNPEVAPAREIAGRLGLPWINIIYDNKMIEGFIKENRFHNYYPYASELVSMFFMQDYFAVRYLADNELIPDDTIFMPGYSGDFLAGQHVAPFMKRLLTDDKLIRHIIRKHFIMCRLTNNERRDFMNRIRMEDQDNVREPWLLYESWEMKERQAKFIVNSASVFTFFGYDFVLPIWDNRLIDFFNSVPFRYKLRKRLYDHTLTSHFFKEMRLTLKNELNPTHFQLTIQNLKEVIKRGLPASIVEHFVDRMSPVLYDEISKQLIDDAGYSMFQKPPAINNYNSYLTQWYLQKTIEKFNKHV